MSVVVDSLATCSPGLSCLASLRASAPVVAPSLLMCDFGRLQDEVHRLEAAGVRILHLDVMDGHFVPNLSYGLTLVEAFRRMTRLPLEVHLMISNPADYVDKYAAAGADVLTVHLEAVPDPRPVLSSIRGLGMGAGLAINPNTPWQALLEYLPLCDLALVMSVQPGFGGQSFDPGALDKLRGLRAASDGRVLLEVDGGVNRHTIAGCAQAGAQLLVVGSAIFKSPNYTATVGELIALAKPS